MEVALCLLVLCIVSLVILMLNHKLNNKFINQFEGWLQKKINILWANIQMNLLLFRDIVYDHVEKTQNRTELPEMSNRIALITGGTRGIGVEVVRMLLRCDTEVIIACRDMSAGHNVVRSIRESGVSTGKVKIMYLDNSRLSSVKNFIESFKIVHDKLDILINNAGIFGVPYEETEDGFESHWAVNYLSHFLLTLSLLPLLKNSKDTNWTGRIVNVSSCTHEMGSIRFRNVNNKNNYISLENYAQSKLAILMFTKKLKRMFDNLNIPILVNAVHPGIVDTDIFSHDHSYYRHLKFFSKLLIKNAYQGAVSIVFAAVSPRVKNKSGLYFYNCIERPVSSYVEDEVIQDQLFNLSIRQVKLNNFNESTLR